MSTPIAYAYNISDVITCGEYGRSPRGSLAYTTCSIPPRSGSSNSPENEVGQMRAGNHSRGGDGGGNRYDCLGEYDR